MRNNGQLGKLEAVLSARVLVDDPAAAVSLFLVVLGGRSAGCHVEQHDVRFVAGRTIDDTLPELRRQWFGRREGLHLDSVLAVDGDHLDEDLFHGGVAKRMPLQQQVDSQHGGQRIGRPTALLLARR